MHISGIEGPQVGPVQIIAPYPARGGNVDLVIFYHRRAVASPPDGPFQVVFVRAVLGNISGIRRIPAEHGKFIYRGIDDRCGIIEENILFDIRSCRGPNYRSELWDKKQESGYQNGRSQMHTPWISRKETVEPELLFDRH